MYQEGYLTRCYAKTKVKGESFIMHRLIMNAKKGDYIDHINHDGLDNRENNLRICTNRQNAPNSRIKIMKIKQVNIKEF